MLQILDIADVGVGIPDRKRLLRLTAKEKGPCDSA